VLLTGYFGGYSEQSDDYRRTELDVADAMAGAAHAAERPLVVQSMYPRSATSARLRERGVAVYGDIEAAAAALGRTAAGLLKPPLGMPEVIAPGRPGAPPDSTDYFGARRLLSEVGIAFVEARAVNTEPEALAAAASLGYPVVLKALGRNHKSDAGGVRLGLKDDAALVDAFRNMHTTLRPPLCSVEQQAPTELGVELLIGARRDRSFGPIALVGFGGLYIEVLRDLAVALAPVSVEQATQLIRSLRGADLLSGRRGRPQLDISSAARALVAISTLAADHAELAEIEVNPLLVLESGALALDARLSAG
jgi:acyl-CoA synthetase (NDP forming)